MVNIYNVESNLAINTLYNNFFNYFYDYLILFIFFILANIENLYKIKANKCKVLNIFFNKYVFINIVYIRQLMNLFSFFYLA